MLTKCQYSDMRGELAGILIPKIFDFLGRTSKVNRRFLSCLSPLLQVKASPCAKYFI